MPGILDDEHSSALVTRPQPGAPGFTVGEAVASMRRDLRTVLGNAAVVDVEPAVGS
jgi:hypothetical protein